MSASDDQLIEEICRRTEKLRLLRSLGPDQGLPLIPRSERLSRSAKTFTHDPANATVATRAAFTAEIETLQYNSEWSSRAIVTNQADNANISKKMGNFKKKSADDVRSMDERMVAFNERLTKTEDDVESLGETAEKMKSDVGVLKSLVSENKRSIKKAQRCASLNSRNLAANRIQTTRLERKTDTEFKKLKCRLSKIEAELKKTKTDPAPKVPEEIPGERNLMERFRTALGFNDKSEGTS
eukprot:278809_1